MMTPTQPQRGFTLLVAVLLSVVALTLGMSLLDISLKQVTLASTAKQSGAAFYSADAALECTLFWDQKQNQFAFGTTTTGAGVTCSNIQVTSYSAAVDPSSTHIWDSSYSVACAGGGTNATVKVYKTDGTVSCNGGTAKTCIYVTGYNSCSSTDPRATERGIKVSY